jgi:hypothetical protein
MREYCCSIDDEMFESFVSGSLSPLSILTSFEPIPECTFYEEETCVYQEESNIYHKVINSQESPIVYSSRDAKVSFAPVKNDETPNVYVSLKPTKRTLTFTGCNRRRRKFNMPEDQFILCYSLTK